MNSIDFPQGARLSKSITTDELIAELEKYGHPNIMKMDSGKWIVSVDVFVSGEGVNFNVKGEDEKSHCKALSQCYERVLAAMKKIRETT